MTFVIIAVLAFVAFKLWRLAIRAGAEGLRAYIYLESRNKGLSTQDANAVADAVAGNPGSEMTANALRIWNTEKAAIHAGKQLPVIGYAYRQGMHPKMPAWYAVLVRNAPMTLGLEVSYGILKPTTQIE